MRIFEVQRKSRFETTKLVLLFGIAVVFIVATIDLVVLKLVQYVGVHLPWQTVVLSCSILTFGIILGGYVYHRHLLSDGGRAVATMLGGVEVNHSSKDIYERRFLNVVAESSIAANIPVPSVFILENEDSINAFAAGYSSNDYVIAATRGAITKLSRDELQGVVAHEAGHLANGDSLLNIHLLSMLGGLMCIALFGGWLADTAADTSRIKSKNNPAGLLILLGIALWIIGYFGVFLGKCIKAMISREREFYADARAVQFTRNPDGIGSALRKIAGFDSKIRHYNSTLLSYMFLEGDSSSWMDEMFATHPPIKDRIKRIYGRSLPELKVHTYPAEYVEAEMGNSLVSGFVGIPLINNKITSNVGIPGSLRLDNILNNQEMLFGLLIAIVDVDGAADNSIVKLQNPNKILNFSRLVKKDVSILSLHEKLTVLNILAPMIRNLSDSVKSELQESITLIVAADNKCTLEEFLFSAILYHRSKLQTRTTHTKLDTQVLPLLMAFSKLSGSNAIDNYKTSVSLLGFDVHTQITDRNDYAHLLDMLSNLKNLEMVDRKRLMNALRVAATGAIEISTEAGSALNVLAAVLEIPEASFNVEQQNFTAINRVFNI